MGDGPPALAIALDRRKNTLLDPPLAPQAPLLDPAALRFILLDGLVKGGIGLLLLLILPRLGATTAATATAVFVYEGVAKLLSMFPARRLFGGLNPNRWVAAATVVSVALQLSCIVFAPVREMLGLVELPASLLLSVSAALLLTFALGEVILRGLRGAAARHVLAFSR